MVEQMVQLILAVAEVVLEVVLLMYNLADQAVAEL